MRPICRLPVSTIALVSSLMLFGTEKAAANFNEIQGIIKPQLNIEWSRHIRQIVRDIGGTRFISQMNQVDTSDAVTEPAGIYTVVPTADLATSQSAVGWNVWLDGNAGYLERNFTKII